MSLASELSGIAVELMNDPDFGATVTHKVYTNGAYDPDSGENTRTSTEYTLKAVLETVGAKNKPDGKDLKIGDKIVHIASADITVIPKVSKDHFIVINDEIWNIVSAPQEVSVAGTDIIYSVVCRR